MNLFYIFTSKKRFLPTNKQTSIFKFTKVLGVALGEKFVSTNWEIKVILGAKAAKKTRSTESQKLSQRLSYQILDSKFVLIDPQTTKIWSTDLNVPLSVTDGVSDTLVREKLSLLKCVPYLHR